MKISICFIVAAFLIVQNVGAQNIQTYEKLKSTMWGDPEFKTVDVPEKWKNESAVILAKSYVYEVEKEVLLNYIHEDIYLHKRIKLLDKSAVNEFSEFSFENDYKNTSFWASYELKDVSIGIKVIKPTGKENIIDLKDAVLNEIKEGYKKKEYKKIAIPDLEVGDIIDYFYVVKNTYVEQYMKIMDPVFYQLVEQYPIVKQKFDVHILRQMYFNSKPMNGAPELKKVIKDEKTIYSFIDTDREKADANLWSYPFRIYPTLKFQAFFIKNRALAYLQFLDFFLDEKKTNSSSVDMTNFDGLVKDIYKTPVLFDQYLISETKNYLSANVSKTAPADTIVKYAYYYLRQKTDDYGANSLMLNLSKVLEFKKIQHDLVITIPNFVSDISDLIIPQEIAYLLRIKGKPDYYIGDFTKISLFKSISSDYQGNNAYAVNNPNLVSNPKVEKIVIPIDSPENNSEIVTLNIKMSPDAMDSLDITLEKSVKGIGRKEDIGYVVTETGYNDEVHSILFKPKSAPKKKSPKQLKEEKNKSMLNEQQQKDVAESINAMYRREFNEDEDFKVYAFSLNQAGIWDSKPELKYKVSFKVGNLVKKMGPNYLISIGKTITRQLELDKEDLKRKTDVYAPYPRSFGYKLNMEIPSGYKVKGLEKLNVAVNNTTGGFTGKAEMKGNTLVIDLKKYYNHNFEKSSEWPKMVEFIEAAFNYTQQNILLEKI